ncbi:secondary thiamine-phosphate synthase enzyme YjbQ [Hoeflea ulvae]|uniref:Secondary thiamine-phosphate synthase enzyme YjbQ n=1 Tax=Hoeflea ulvae TaxID=2983764 RepID=A0ABT3YMD3_9HYPH|nr:secondary thiamine-phosphate synthase enzyme YjbQ [Hoeflea ulvae]MCY0097073.1 secondary thiamine-phosphate synthase enzyme YjbQ [Hoeflea ulvae]
MQQLFFDMMIRTQGKSLVPIEDLLMSEIQARRLDSGLLTIWCKHTGASLLVQANADDDVTADILAFFEELAPQTPGRYHHKADQPDNAPSHLRALLTQTQTSVPVHDGLLPLGDVQSLYLFEHRETPKTRRLLVHFIGQLLADESQMMVM